MKAAASMHSCVAKIGNNLIQNLLNLRSSLKIIKPISSQLKFTFCSGDTLFFLLASSFSCHIILDMFHHMPKFFVYNFYAKFFFKLSKNLSFACIKVLARAEKPIFISFLIQTLSAESLQFKVNKTIGIKTTRANHYHMCKSANNLESYIQFNFDYII